jgi:hypothetical protein
MKKVNCTNIGMGYPFGEKPKIKFIFAGAGVSKATNPNKYPTTVDFYDRLGLEVRNDELFKSVDSYLKMTKGNINATIDVEEILWTMDDLGRETDFFANGNNLLGRFLSQSEVQKAVGKTFDFSALRGLSKEVSG